MKIWTPWREHLTKLLPGRVWVSLLCLLISPESEWRILFVYDSTVAHLLWTPAPPEQATWLRGRSAFSCDGIKSSSIKSLQRIPSTCMCFQCVGCMARPAIPGRSQEGSHTRLLLEPLGHFSEKRQNPSEPLAPSSYLNMHSETKNTLNPHKVICHAFQCLFNVLWK